MTDTLTPTTHLALPELEAAIARTVASLTPDPNAPASSQHFIDTGRYLTATGEDPKGYGPALASAVSDLFVLLAKVDPRRAYTTFTGLDGAVRGAEYPRLYVGVDPDLAPDASDYDLTIPEDAAEYAEELAKAECLLDPDTDKPAHVISVDVAERWNHERNEGDDRESGHVTFDYDGHGDWEGRLYLSSETERPVRLPEGWVED